MSAIKRLIDRLRIGNDRPAKVTPTATRGIDLAVDRNGHRYTSHTFGFEGDPWRGATILTPGVVARLSRDGLLPLTEVRAVSDDAGSGS